MDPEVSTDRTVALSQGVLCCVQWGGSTVSVEKDLDSLALRSSLGQELSTCQPGCHVQGPSGTLTQDAPQTFRQTRNSSKMAAVCCGPT